jgi:hypothetical protein
MMKDRPTLPRLILLVAGACLTLSPSPFPAAAQDRPKTETKKSITEEDIRKWVKQLDSPDTQDQQEATKRLIEIAEPALPALREAAKNSSAEGRKRAEGVIAEIEKWIRGSVSPADVSLELRLVAKRATSELDLDGKEEKDYRKLVEEMAEKAGSIKFTKLSELREKLPPASKVDMVLELKNTGTKPVHLLFGRRIAYDKDFRAGKYANVVFRSNLERLEAQGPAVIEVNGPGVGTGRSHKDAEGYKSAPLAAGEVWTWPLTELRYGPWGHGAYWTKPGEYAVRALLDVAVGEEPFGPPTGVLVYSNWVKVKVVEPKK